jgi:hypothetical protein
VRFGFLKTLSKFNSLPLVPQYYYLLGIFLAIDLQHPSNQATYIVNRVSALVVIWFAYYFTLRYRKTQENEHTQRIELEERRLAETRLRVV